MSMFLIVVHAVPAARAKSPLAKSSLLSSGVIKIKWSRHKASFVPSERYYHHYLGRFRDAEQRLIATATFESTREIHTHASLCCLPPVLMAKPGLTIGREQQRILRGVLSVSFSTHASLAPACARRGRITARANSM
jgi:hypothetical protein